MKSAEAEEELIVDGMKGYGLSGTAINKSNSNRRVGVYQLILASPQGGYFRIVGVAPSKRFSSRYSAGISAHGRQFPVATKPVKTGLPQKRCLMQSNCSNSIFALKACKII